VYENRVLLFEENWNLIVKALIFDILEGMDSLKKDLPVIISDFFFLRLRKILT